MEKGRSASVCVRTRENISPISGCRVSGYAQRVITLSWRAFLHLAYVHAVLLPSPPLRAPICSFAGRSPLHLPHAPMVHPCDARFYSLARLQRQRNTIRPARKWRNYIRGRVEEERKSQREATGRARLGRGVSRPPKTRFGKGSENFSFLPRNRDESALEDAKRAVIRSLLRNGGRIIFHSFCSKSLLRKQETREQERISNLSSSYSRPRISLRKLPTFSHSIFIIVRERCCVTDDYLRCKVQYPSRYDGVTSEESRSRDSLLDNVTDNRWRFAPRGSYRDDMGAMSSA